MEAAIGIEPMNKGLQTTQATSHKHIHADIADIFVPHASCVFTCTRL